MFLAPSRRWDGQVVGLYGGSFNPAHDGHAHVSAQALKHLRLDALWWLVSPQNPLKEASDMAPLEKRKKSAQQYANNRKIYVTTIEDRLQSRYSYQTIKQLTLRFRRTRFVWIMGADNLATFHHWQQWRAIFQSLPIAVIDRPGYSSRAIWSPAGRVFRRYRRPQRSAFKVARMRAPAWVYLTGPLHAQSATAMRAKMPHWITHRGTEDSA